jgi:prephenate dehydratase
MSLCDAIAEAKFRAAPFSYLLRTADLPTLLTDPRREQLIAASRSDDFTRIMDVSKRIQLKSLQKLIANARIGYLFGIGTFSHEAVTEFFNGQHTPYPSVEALYAAVRSGEIDHALVPIYNNNIGTIFEPPAEFQTVGQVQKRITLSVFTNSTNALPSNMPYHTLFVERHVYAESQEALQSRFLYRNLQFVPSSRDGTVEVAKQREPCLTVASSNIQGLLYELAHNIVPYNFTTFSLITNR